MNNNNNNNKKKTLLSQEKLFEIFVKAFFPSPTLQFYTKEQQSANTRVNEDLKKPEIRNFQRVQ